MTAVTIPPEVLADVAARPEAYRPEVEVDDVIHVLHCDCERNAHIGHQGVIEALGGLVRRLRVDFAHGWCGDVTAWALVGSVDGGPRPEVGQRVLVLECSGADAHEDEHAGRVGAVVSSDPADCREHIDVDLRNARGDWVDSCLAARWALLPNPAPDAPGAPLPATATPDPARGDTPEAFDAADDVSQNPLRNRAARVICTCGAREGEPHIAPDGSRLLPADAPRLPADEEARWRAGEPTYADMLAAMERQRAAAAIPPGRWRTGLHWGRAPGVMATLVEEGAGPADDEGRRPDDRLVGSLLAPDAALVVDAVNGVRSAHARGQEIADQRDAALLRWRAEGVRMRAERDEALAEVERLRARVAELEEARGGPSRG